MRLVRAAHRNRIVFGRVEDDTLIVLTEESTRPGADALRELLAAGADLSVSGQRVPLNDVRLLAPVGHPEKVLCVGLNYAEHVLESRAESTATPVFFNKMPNTVIGVEAEIVLSADSSVELDYEAELVAVIGRRVRNIGVEDALEAVLGYTAGNDISARDAQFPDVQWLRGKSMDTFAPIGPAIVTSDEIGDPQRLDISCRVNGEVRQESNTAMMIHSVAFLVAYASRFFTLEPGDLIFTGTPEGVGFARTPPSYLRDGDKVEVEIADVGTLTNTVRYLS